MQIKMMCIFCVWPFERKDFQFYKITLAIFLIIYYNTLEYSVRLYTMIHFAQYFEGEIRYGTYVI